MSEKRMDQNLQKRDVSTKIVDLCIRSTELSNGRGNKSRQSAHVNCDILRM